MRQPPSILLHWSLDQDGNEWFCCGGRAPVLWPTSPNYEDVAIRGMDHTVTDRSEEKRAERTTAP